METERGVWDGVRTCAELSPLALAPCIGLALASAAHHMLEPTRHLHHLLLLQPYHCTDSTTPSFQVKAFPRWLVRVWALLLTWLWRPHGAADLPHPTLAHMVHAHTQHATTLYTKQDTPHDTKGEQGPVSLSRPKIIGLCMTWVRQACSGDTPVSTAVSAPEHATDCAFSPSGSGTSLASSHTSSKPFRGSNSPAPTHPHTQRQDTRAIT